MSITTQHTVWCEVCGNWEQATTRTKAAMARVARRAGWSLSTRGWLCPGCKEKHKKGELDDDAEGSGEEG